MTTKIIHQTNTLLNSPGPHNGIFCPPAYSRYRRISQPSPALTFASSATAYRSPVNSSLSPLSFSVIPPNRLPDSSLSSPLSSRPGPLLPLPPAYRKSLSVISSSLPLLPISYPQSPRPTQFLSGMYPFMIFVLLFLLFYPKPMNCFSLPPESCPCSKSSLASLLTTDSSASRIMNFVTESPIRP